MSAADLDYKGARARCEAATPGPWRRWRQPAGVGCAWKDALPSGTVTIESTGTVFALGVAVLASPTESDADFAIGARADLPATLDALATMARHVRALHEVLRRDHPHYEPPADVAAILEAVR